MTRWNDLPSEIKNAIVRATLASLARDCESRTSYYEPSPSLQLKSFLAILLTNRECHYMAINTQMTGVDSCSYFQSRQREMILNLSKYALGGYDPPCPFLDYRDVEDAAGRFWQNPLIYRDFGLVDMTLLAFKEGSTPRLLCYMKRFFEANFEETPERFTFHKNVGKGEILRPGQIQRQLTVTTGNLQIQPTFDRKIYSIADISLSPPIGPDDSDQWTTEYPRMKQNLSSWVFISFDAEGQFPDDWYLCNYEEQCVYDERRIGFERGEEIQNAIEHWRVDLNSLMNYAIQVAERHRAE